MKINDRSLSNNRNYVKLSSDFKFLAEAFLENIPSSLCVNSTKSYFEHGCKFLLHLEKCGVATSFENITHEDVVSFFIDIEGNKIRNADYKKHVSRFLEIISLKVPSIKRVKNLLPAIRRIRKLRNRFTDSECKAISKALLAEPAILSVFDKAVGCLLYYMGLRKVDIALLKPKNIVWERDEIIIEQKKTGVKMKCYLTAIVGNALIDLLLELKQSLGRPVAGDECIFAAGKNLTQQQLCNKIKTASEHIYDAAKIRLNKNDERGCHLFRHAFVNRAKDAGVPQPVISHMVGHQSPASLQPYLYSNINQLKSCALSIEKYPVPDEVYHG